jgi:Protein of unknown function (DUF2752)
VSKLALMVLLPPVLLILPKNFFDKGKSICLSKLLFHTECYGCGMTRACMHLIHLDFEEAYSYNMLSFIVLPLLAVVWIQWYSKEWRVLKQLKASGQQV